MPPCAARSALSLEIHGLGDGERGVLESMLRLLEPRLERRWTLDGRGHEVDLWLHRPGAPQPQRVPRLQGLVLRDDEHADDPDALVLQLPLRVGTLFGVLEAASNRLTQQAQLPWQWVDALAGDEARMSADAAPLPLESHLAETGDGNALAAALARLLKRRAGSTLRVRIGGHGTLYLCGGSGRYCVDFPLQQLLPALQQRRYVITVIAPDAPGLGDLMQAARPLDELLWSIGMCAPWTRAPQPQDRFALRHWPDLARLAHRRAHLRASALLATNALCFDELQPLSGLGASDLGQFLHACELCGLLREGDDLDAEPATGGGLRVSGAADRPFDRLLRRFGL